MRLRLLDIQERRVLKYWLGGGRQGGCHCRQRREVGAGRSGVVEDVREGRSVRDGGNAGSETGQSWPVLNTRDWDCDRDWEAREVLKLCLEVSGIHQSRSVRRFWLLSISVVKKLRYWERLALDRCDWLGVERQCLLVIWQ